MLNWFGTLKLMFSEAWKKVKAFFGYGQPDEYYIIEPAPLSPEEEELNKTRVAFADYNSSTREEVLRRLNLQQNQWPGRHVTAPPNESHGYEPCNPNRNRHQREAEMNFVGYEDSERFPWNGFEVTRPVVPEDAIGMSLGPVIETEVVDPTPYQATTMPAVEEYQSIDNAPANYGWQAPVSEPAASIDLSNYGVPSSDFGSNSYSSSSSSSSSDSSSSYSSSSDSYSSSSDSSSSSSDSSSSSWD